MLREKASVRGRVRHVLYAKSSKKIAMKIANVNWTLDRKYLDSSWVLCYTWLYNAVQCQFFSWTKESYFSWMVLRAWQTSGLISSLSFWSRIAERDRQLVLSPTKPSHELKLVIVWKGTCILRQEPACFPDGSPVTNHTRPPKSMPVVRVSPQAWRHWFMFWHLTGGPEVLNRPRFKEAGNEVVCNLSCVKTCSPV